MAGQAGYGLMNAIRVVDASITGPIPARCNAVRAMSGVKPSASTAGGRER